MFNIYVQPFNFPLLFCHSNSFFLGPSLLPTPVPSNNLNTGYHSISKLFRWLWRSCKIWALANYTSRIRFGSRPSVSLLAFAISSAQLHVTSWMKQAKLPMLFVNVSTKTSLRPTSGPYDNMENKRREKFWGWGIRQRSRSSTWPSIYRW